MVFEWNCCLYFNDISELLNNVKESWIQLRIKAPQLRSAWVLSVKIEIRYLNMYSSGLGWVGGDYGHRAEVQWPALGTVLWPPSISLRTAPSHQAGLFQRKVSLHGRGRNTSTGATLTVFIQYSSFTVFIQYSSFTLILKHLGIKDRFERILVKEVARIPHWGYLQNQVIYSLHKGSKEHKRLSKITRVSFRQYNILDSLLVPETKPCIRQPGKAATPLQVILNWDLFPIAVLPRHIEHVSWRPAPSLL